uniref:CCHC-type domain-containing protein n=1 Tax=Tanacetum cinerariifolium TaxID=118510 RepID=A0A6L2MZP7_TANCI|nr:hypothetical protein [Tanacetum cinerariifolium]
MYITCSISSFTQPKASMDSCWTCGNPFHSYENCLEEIASRKEREPETYDYRSQYDAYEYDTHHTNYNMEMEDDTMYQGKDYAKIIKNQSKPGNIGHKIGSLHQKPNQQAFFYSNQPMKPKMSKDSKFKGGNPCAYPSSNRRLGSNGEKDLDFLS